MVLALSKTGKKHRFCRDGGHGNVPAAEPGASVMCGLLGGVVEVVHDLAAVPETVGRPRHPVRLAAEMYSVRSMMTASQYFSTQRRENSLAGRGVAASVAWPAPGAPIRTVSI